MNIGELRHRIIIQHNVTAGQMDGNGIPLAEDWQPLVSVYAKKTPLSLSRIGRFFYQAGAIQNESDMVFTIHYREDIKPGMVIVDGKETYGILVPPADPDGYRQWLIIHASQVKANGG